MKTCGCFGAFSLFNMVAKDVWIPCESSYRQLSRMMSDPNVQLGPFQPWKSGSACDVFLALVFSKRRYAVCCAKTCTSKFPKKSLDAVRADQEYQNEICFFQKFMKRQDYPVTWLRPLCFRTFPLPVLLMPRLKQTLFGFYSHPNYVFSEQLLQRIFIRILYALVHLHGEGYVHRDLSAGNILVSIASTTAKEVDEVFLSDFGRCIPASDPCCPTQRNQTTLEYSAPEMKSSFSSFRCSFPVDLWSVGSIMAEMISTTIFLFRHRSSAFHPCNKPPHTLTTTTLLDTCKPLVSSSCFDLLSRLLQTNPQQRITASHAFCHSWFPDSLRQSLFDNTKTQLKSP
jgi:serine/threonine protein kinase